MKTGRMGTVLAVCALVSMGAGFAAWGQGTYSQLVLRDEPAVYWRFDEGYGAIGGAKGEAVALTSSLQGRVSFGRPGPRHEDFVAFSPDNSAVELDARSGAFIRVRDPGEGSMLDFGKGDSITLEAWVNLAEIGSGRNTYIIGKGRTGSPGQLPNNQNYALRLWNRGGEGGHLSFLFRAEGSERKGGQEHWHRWTSTPEVVAGSGWHHLAVAYTFGAADSLRAYIDGEKVRGEWDYGGATDSAPVVDNDELWIGSSMGGKPGTSFNGLLDEVAIYRKALSGEAIRQRASFKSPSLTVDPATLPPGRVRVEILENLPVDNSWNFLPPEPVESYTAPVFAFPALPNKYSSKGIRVDRSNPFLVRASGVVKLAPGEHRLLVRARSSARLILDGEVLLETPFATRNGSGHEGVPELSAEVPEGTRLLRPGLNEMQVTVTSDGGGHVFTLEAFIGGNKLRPEPSELSVSIAGGEGEGFYLLSPGRRISLTDLAWNGFFNECLDRMAALNQTRRLQAGAKEAEYWERRHEIARRQIKDRPAPEVPEAVQGFPANNEIDRFVNARIAAAGKEPVPVVNDLAFLRRLSLDAIGTVPTVKQIEAFLSDPAGERRAKAIERFLAHPGWADHWVGYWQDALAENPGILKPTLNNTGPFRYWIHESFLDNKPMDRFVAELVAMEGSKYYGGPAGFEMATENDVPYAAKAHVLGTAFLGMNMACARCHDAPYHEFKQGDLFSLAAMLKRGEQVVPKSSSIPPDSNIIVGRLVNVSLEPGQKVAPGWPFAGVMKNEFPEGVLRDPKDTRERLAALVTDARNERFARVMANRLWKRYLGWGLVEPAHDWETAKPSHPGLLDYLAREFVMGGYDLKQVARSIFNSHAYQREVGTSSDRVPDREERLFASAVRRRLDAEQLVDSLFVVAGKDMNTEELTLDTDGRRPVSTFLNFGHPRRAWEFTGLSNERDRPALAMPKIQSVVDVLSVFGWRESRSNPITMREEDPNVLQPATLANGIVGSRRIARLSEPSAFTGLAVEAESLDGLLDGVFLRVLSRKPTAGESAVFVDYLKPGFERRVVKKVSDWKPEPRVHAVSWSNHLSPEATRIKLEMERLAREGDVPTDRLDSDWRRRMEDVVWALINTPEFVFVP